MSGSTSYGTNLGLRQM